MSDAVLMLTFLSLTLLATAAMAQTAPGPATQAAGQAASTTQPAPALVGAIRWEAWHGDLGEPGKAVQKALGPKEWHGRLPFFAKVVSDTQVEIQGATQEVMDQEIAYARRAGLDYFAFVTYPPDASMSLGLKLFLSSQRKEGMKFCLFIENARFGTRANHRANIERFAELMGEPSYQRVLGGRPLLYVGFLHEGHLKSEWGGEEGFRGVLDELRGLVRKQGQPEPYIVIADFDAKRGGELRAAFHADALSSYVKAGPGHNGTPYAELAAGAEKFWNECAATGSEVVPIAVAGWDRRPRIMHPVPWEKGQKPGEGMERYYAAPTPAELGAHIAQAVKWVDKHPAKAPSRAVLVYAWNENDEGGWLVPTLGEGTARIEAVARALGRGK
ncbi:MAG: hypothetical protein NTW19_20995 [Planctomycetota bacterium]|nr:hypothetical protein [Planctomycetota bacterium]